MVKMVSLSYVNFRNPEEKPIFNSFFTTLYYLVPLGFNSLIAGTGVLLGDKLNQMTGQASSMPSSDISGGGSTGGGKSGPSNGGSEAAEAGEGASEAVEVAGAAALL